MKVLVTGGAGYIGSVAVERLIAAGIEVVVFDNLFKGHRAAVHPEALFIEGDLQDPAAIEAVFQKQAVDAVLHYASHTLVGESVQHPMLYLRDNVISGANLLRSCLEHGVRRFILSSTANLFDDPQQMPITEAERIVPGSPYGESKHMLERMLFWLEQTHQMRYAALRYFNAAGATIERGEDHTPECHLIPIVLQVALGQREKVVVYGDDYPTQDGTCVRDYIHVADLADAHILALNALDETSCTYNLGNGRGFSVMQVINAARDVTGCEIPYEIGQRRTGDPAVLVAGSEKISTELGWEPKYPELHEIIESAWKWHRAHPDGYSGS